MPLTKENESWRASCTTVMIFPRVPRNVGVKCFTAKFRLGSISLCRRRWRRLIPASFHWWSRHPRTHEYTRTHTPWNAQARSRSCWRWEIPVEIHKYCSNLLAQTDALRRHVTNFSYGSLFRFFAFCSVLVCFLGIRSFRRWTRRQRAHWMEDVSMKLSFMPTRRKLRVQKSVFYSFLNVSCFDPSIVFLGCIVHHLFCRVFDAKITSTQTTEQCLVRYLERASSARLSKIYCELTGSRSGNSKKIESRRRERNLRLHEIKSICESYLVNILCQQICVHIYFNRHAKLSFYLRVLVDVIYR